MSIGAKNSQKSLTQAEL